MTDNEYLNQAEILLSAVERNCDSFNAETDVDIDNQRVGGMITLTFSNSSQIVINMQKPLHEIWLASRQGGYHFKWRDHCWIDTKNSQEFFSLLSEHATLQANQALIFSEN